MPGVHLGRVGRVVRAALPLPLAGPSGAHQNSGLGARRRVSQHQVARHGVSLSEHSRCVCCVYVPVRLVLSLTLKSGRGRFNFIVYSHNHRQLGVRITRLATRARTYLANIFIAVRVR